jgi:hypothetical protein
MLQGAGHTTGQLVSLSDLMASRADIWQLESMPPVDTCALDDD